MLLSSKGSEPTSDISPVKRRCRQEQFWTDAESPGRSLNADRADEVRQATSITRTGSRVDPTSHRLLTAPTALKNHPKSTRIQSKTTHFCALFSSFSPPLTRPFLKISTPPPRPFSRSPLKLEIRPFRGGHFSPLFSTSGATHPSRKYSTKIRPPPPSPSLRA